MANARDIAVKALLAVSLDDGYSNIVLDSAVKSSGLSGADAALASALFYGVLDRRITLDYIIKQCSSRSPKVPELVREVLRTAVYQLVYMDKIPPFAAVNEAVKAVKKSKFSFAAGYVNAVLRQVQRQAPTLPQDDSVQSVSVRYSCEPWIVERLFADYGTAAAKSVLESALTPPPLYLRVNSQKCSADMLVASLESDGIKAKMVDSEPYAVIASGAVEPTAAYRGGLFHVQDLACQQCCEALCLNDGMRVLDCCAAPGGKTFTVAQLMNATGEVVARDIYPHRVKLITDGAARLGLGNIVAKLGDASVYDASLGEFDRVLCDVPCSGIGVIRRKPDIKYKSPQGIDALPELQYKILTSGAQSLKSGGVLVYSTCTLFKSENSEVVSRFLAEHKDFEPYPFENGQYMRTLMPQDGTDGFFYARIRRR